MSVAGRHVDKIVFAYKSKSLNFSDESGAGIQMCISGQSDSKMYKIIRR